MKSPDSIPPGSDPSSWQRMGGSSCSASGEFCLSHSRNWRVASGDTCWKRRPACSPAPSQANSAASSNEFSIPGNVKTACQRPVGRRRLGMPIAIPPSLRSIVVTFMLLPASVLRKTTGICTATRAFRRRSLFISARAARKLDLARSLVTGLYSTKCAPISNTAFSPMMGSTMATATACLLHGAVRALRSTSVAPSSIMSTMIASNRSRVSLRKALSESAHNSTAISRSPSTRRNTLTIFSSEHSTNDFRLMAGPIPNKTQGSGGRELFPRRR